MECCPLSPSKIEVALAISSSILLLAVFSRE